MKKYIITALMLILTVFCGCTQSTQAQLPSHDILIKSAVAPDDADSLTRAYIAATDASVNRICNTKKGSAPEYISFDFGTHFALKQSQRDKLMQAFEVYGIPLDADGLAAHNTLEEHSRGFIVQYVVGSTHTSKKYDLTITVEIWYGNKGYATYCDFLIDSNGNYVFSAFDNAYENLHITH